VGEYIIVYCIEGADVFILRVVHGRRDLKRCSTSEPRVVKEEFGK
jgi:hypothetical protein